MSSLSPSRRLRTRTSDFFRGTTSSQAPSTSVSVPHLPHNSEGDASAPSKSKRSRIPFLGRSRKKSSQSELQSSSSTTDLTGSVQAGSSPEVQTQPQESSRPPPESLPSTLPGVSPVSLGSKLAAHFTPSKSPPSNLRLPASSKIDMPKTSDPNLMAPDSPRPRASSEILSSRSVEPVLPHPAPIITVSLSPPDDPEDDSFEDLFTRPDPYPAFTQDGHDDKLEMLVFAPPSPPGTPRMHFGDPHSDNGHPQRPLSSDIPPDVSEDLQSSTKPSYGKALGVVSGTEVDVESTEGSEDNGKIILHAATEDNHGRRLDSPSGLDADFNPSPPPSASNRRTLATMPCKVNEQTSYYPKSIMRPPSSGRGPITGPPSIPLPSPPASVSSLPMAATLQTLPSRKSLSSIQQSSRRPRAHTITSVFPPNLPISSPPTPPSAPKKPRPKVQHRLPDATIGLDIENATPDQLKAALVTERRLYDDFLVTVSEKHSAEKMTLQKKIEILERDVRKANREIKGLRYLVINGSTVAEPGLLGTGTASLPDFGMHMQRTSSDDPQRSAKSLQKDRPTSMGVPINAKMAAGLGLDFSTPDMPSLQGGFTAVEHRLSVSSLSSAGSSTSSLSIPDPTAATTTLLAVIPETVSRSPSPLSEPESPRDPSVATAILGIEKQKEKEERRTSRALHRLSSSSTSSVSLAPAVAAYPTTLKRGRPPSIGQVLDDSQNLEDVLEKLRPFGVPPVPIINPSS